MWFFHQPQLLTQRFSLLSATLDARAFQHNIFLKMYHIGVAKTDITAFKLGVGMMGYGMYFNMVKGVDTDLFARAVVIKDSSSGKKVVLVNAEICFITIAIKRETFPKFSLGPGSISGESCTGVAIAA